jgi:hypothetical protein
MSATVIFLLGDAFGFLALGLITFTAIFMLIRKKLLKLTRNLELLRKLHIFAGAAGGFFLVLHASYFISWPLTEGIILGYVSTAVATVVWLTGTAFLERFRDSLFFHGTLSMAAISLMVIHAASAGINFPVLVAYGILLTTTIVVIYKASQHTTKALKAAGIQVG